MIIDLSSFSRESRCNAVFPGTEIDLETENHRVVGDVTIDATVTKSAAATLLRGGISGSIEVACDRCLELVTNPFDIEVSLQFVTVEQFSTEAERELTAEDLNVDAFNGESLDLKAIVREQILLYLPQQLFCKASCKGLCAKCGGNLNLIDCNCSSAEIDPRWAALQSLK
jgi:Predicted metal-binding, possibly nucleic acid-binding protein